MLAARWLAERQVAPALVCAARSSFCFALTPGPNRSPLAPPLPRTQALKEAGVTEVVLAINYQPDVSNGTGRLKWG